eukprot:GFYU01023002.1.p1 GENE.GFYU01023002.1~~GFYU01023002.1.p1  ORF type:complete len:332 (+),score=77.71 GFYU01023002.1:891-1886(+)
MVLPSPKSGAPTATAGPSTATGTGGLSGLSAWGVKVQRTASSDGNSDDDDASRTRMSANVKQEHHVMPDRPRKIKPATKSAPKQSTANRDTATTKPAGRGKPGPAVKNGKLLSIIELIAPAKKTNIAKLMPGNRETISSLNAIDKKKRENIISATEKLVKSLAEILLPKDPMGLIGATFDKLTSSPQGPGRKPKRRPTISSKHAEVLDSFVRDLFLCLEVNKRKSKGRSILRAITSLLPFETLNQLYSAVQLSSTLNPENSCFPVTRKKDKKKSKKRPADGDDDSVDEGAAAEAGDSPEGPRQWSLQTYKKARRDTELLLAGHVTVLSAER